MSSKAVTSATASRAQRSKTGVVPDLVGGLAVASGMAGATWRLLDLPASYLVAAAALSVAGCAIVLATVPGDRPGPGLGAANRVTLFRGAVAAAVAALCVPPVALSSGGLWWVIVVSTVVMVLDGVDGRTARRTGTESAFGARFDMELDAALILVLSVLVWTNGRAGAWCLLMGLMRYLFIAAGWVWPALRAELPPSLRRKVVCVTQGVVLLVALGPIIPATFAEIVVAGGLVGLTYSFAVDVRWALSDG